MNKTCADCIHNDVCEAVERANKIPKVKPQYCRCFKDKSRFIELPCAVGDKVYKISRNKVKECEVVFVGISADEKCSHFNFVENYADGTFYKSYSMVFDVIGKTVFLTKEEAEQKLKEKENDLYM